MIMSDLFLVCSEILSVYQQYQFHGSSSAESLLFLQGHHFEITAHFERESV